MIFKVVATIFDLFEVAKTEFLGYKSNFNGRECVFNVTKLPTLVATWLQASLGNTRVLRTLARLVLHAKTDY